MELAQLPSPPLAQTEPTNVRRKVMVGLFLLSVLTYLDRVRRDQRRHEHGRPDWRRDHEYRVRGIDRHIQRELAARADRWFLLRVNGLLAQDRPDPSSVGAPVLMQPLSRERSPDGLGAKVHLLEAFWTDPRSSGPALSWLVSLRE